MSRCAFCGKSSSRMARISPDSCSSVWACYDPECYDGEALWRWAEGHRITHAELDIILLALMKGKSVSHIAKSFDKYEDEIAFIANKFNWRTA